MTDRGCLEEGCDNPHKAKGYCNKHYFRRLHRIRRGQDPDIAPKKGRRKTGTDFERFCAMVEVDLTTGCWLWTGSLTDQGYGNKFLSDSHLGGIAPHIWAWIWWFGQRPLGENGHPLPLDHTCHTNDHACPGGRTCVHRRCVNPFHLEPVTTLENVRRSRAATKDCCLRDHPLSGTNLRINRDGSRGCRECARQHALATTLRQRKSPVLDDQGRPMAARTTQGSSESKYHIAVGAWEPACGLKSRILSEHAATPATEVAAELRCTRAGCREGWPT